MIPSEIIRKVRKIDIVTSRKVSEGLSGGYHSIFKGRGVEFDEVRPYQPGDEIRFIDWNLMARTGELFTKRFTEERELVVNLLVDVSGSLDIGRERAKREFTTEVAALLAYSAIANNDRVGLILFSDRVEKMVPPRRGRRHVMRLIRELLTFEPAHKGTNLAAAVEKLNQLRSRRSVTFLLSDFMGKRQPMVTPGRIAARRHDLIPIVIRDELERTLPEAGLIHLVDAESGRTHWVDTSSRRIREEFTAAVQRDEQELDRLFADLRVSPVSLGSGDDPVLTLTRYFGQRKTRR